MAKREKGPKINREPAPGESISASKKVNEEFMKAAKALVFLGTAKVFAGLMPGPQSPWLIGIGIAEILLAFGGVGYLCYREAKAKIAALKAS